MNNKLALRYVALGMVIMLALVILAACGSSSEARDRAQVDRQQSVYQSNQPIPFFEWSQDRDVFIQIYRAKNEARSTYAIFSSNGTGETRFRCPSVGFAIPADASLTNPLQPYSNQNGTYEVSVEQAEPNGLFSSKNTDGTYVLCVRKNGDVVPIYTELKVTTFPFAVEWRDGELYEVESSPSSMTINLNPKPVQQNDVTPGPYSTITPSDVISGDGTTPIP